MKILYCASTLSHINNFHLDYINALRESGCEVMVLARGEGADFNIPFEKRIFSPKNLACIRKIRKILDEYSFDVLILNTSLAAFCVRAAVRAGARPKIINTVHGYLFSRNTGILKSLFLFLCERAQRKKTDAIITMNAEDYRTATRFRLARGRVYRTRGMGGKLRAQISNPDNLRAEYASESSFIMTFVGELSRRKNQEFLIRALPSITEELPGVVLWLVGDGEERDRLANLARELDVAEFVVFLGERRDACDFIRASDLYVTSASVEGMPANLIEALGAGKTILASRIKGHEDLIVDNIDGFLYDFGNMDEFVNKTCQIYDKNLEIDKRNIEEKYRIYEKERVLPETLSVLRESIESCF
ncbi:MAG: glycosyltransferase [Clostridia bacterium]|nr:glycosyltransferase [Clostridia bacterium]